MKRVLIIEDETYMVDLLSIHLSNQYELIIANDGVQALEYVEKQEFDLIILDIMLPYLDGWTVCRKIRESSVTPILMLTARNELSDKVKGLEIGADDYLVKPFEFEELKARIKALLRRSIVMKKNEDNIKINILSYSNGLFKLNLDSRELYINQYNVDLTAKEFDLLSLLASAPSRVFSREILLSQVWKDYEERDLRVVDSHIKNIRTKLKGYEKNQKFIRTVWGIGYQFVLPGEE